MRFLLLLLFGAFTALVVPYVINEARQDLFPPNTDVMRAYQDAQEIFRILLESWRAGQEPGTSQPIFEETRLWSTAVVVGVAGQWFQAFMTGGILGLLLLNVRPVTLLVLGGFLAFALYSCTSVKVTHDFSPEMVRGIRLFSLLYFVGLVAGFLTARSFRRTTV